MSKHRFPHFTGEETKLCKTYLLIQGLVRVKKGEAQPAGPSCPYIMVVAVRWEFKVAEERRGCLAVQSLDSAACVTWHVGDVFRWRGFLSLGYKNNPEPQLPLPDALIFCIRVLYILNKKINCFGFQGAQVFLGSFGTATWNEAVVPRGRRSSKEQLWRNAWLALALSICTFY